jgi:hypothetical protein
VTEPALAAEAAEEARRLSRNGESSNAWALGEIRRRSSTRTQFHSIVARQRQQAARDILGHVSLLAHEHRHALYDGNRKHVIAAHQRILDAAGKTRAAAKRWPRTL